MSSYVVTNSGPLITLSKLGLLDLLWTVYGRTLLLSRAVQIEVVEQGQAGEHPDAPLVSLAIARSRLQVESVIIQPSWPGANGLHQGEIESIQLALNYRADLILLDEKRARDVARLQGLTVKGTVGVIVQAYRDGVIRLAEVRAIFDAIKARGDIWISPDLLEDVWRELSRSPR